ncbi:MAG: glycosyltransferase family 4 protein [Pseudomonadota bacterium]
MSLRAKRTGGRVLVLASESYGSIGGIAAYNRDFVSALSADADIDEIRILPRLGRRAPEDLPDRVSWDAAALGGLSAFARRCLGYAADPRRFDVVHCGHINLMPFAAPIARAHGAALSLSIHGIEAWRRPKRRLAAWSASMADRVFSVSRLTARRYRDWASTPVARITIAPNTVSLSRFEPAPRRTDLVARYGLQGKTVIMTLGRLAGRARAKGFDEVIECLPRLAAIVPDIAYLVCGDGEDRARLEAKAASLRAPVVFAGEINEREKADHYALADAFLLPSRGEGFGIVLLEAMACGVPVVASRLDGGREALRDGALGRLVDPRAPDDLVAATLHALSAPRRRPEGLDYFNQTSFRRRIRAALPGLGAPGPQAAQHGRTAPV